MQRVPLLLIASVPALIIALVLLPTFYASVLAAAIIAQFLLFRRPSSAPSAAADSHTQNNSTVALLSSNGELARVEEPIKELTTATQNDSIFKKNEKEIFHRIPDEVQLFELPASTISAEPSTTEREFHEEAQQITITAEERDTHFQQVTEQSELYVEYEITTKQEPEAFYEEPVAIIDHVNFEDLTVRAENPAPIEQSPQELQDIVATEQVDVIPSEMVEEQPQPTEEEPITYPVAVSPSSSNDSVLSILYNGKAQYYLCDPESADDFNRTLRQCLTDFGIEDENAELYAIYHDGSCLATGAQIGQGWTLEQLLYECAPVRVFTFKP